MSRYWYPTGGGGGGPEILEDNVMMQGCGFRQCLPLHRSRSLATVWRYHCCRSCNDDGGFQRSLASL